MNDLKHIVNAKLNVSQLVYFKSMGNIRGLNTSVPIVLASLLIETFLFVCIWNNAKKKITTQRMDNEL